MFSTFTKLSSAAAAAAVISILVAATPADAKDWRLSVQRHYDAEEEARYVPKGGNPQWDFTLDTVVADMEWRQRTARMLHNLPKPSSDPIVREPGQLADRPEPPTLQFAF